MLPTLSQSAVLLTCLALPATACGGAHAGARNEDGATSMPDASTPFGGRDEARTDSGPPTDGAPANWCATQGAHVFCEDFTEGVPDMLTARLSPGTTATPDTTNVSSPPLAMLVTTPALADDGGTALAMGSYSARVTGAHFRLKVDLRIDGSCFANGAYDPVTVLGVDYPTEQYGMTMYVTPATSAAGTVLSVGMQELTYDADGGAVFESGGGEFGFFPTDVWETYTLWADEPSVGGFSVSPAGIGVGGGIMGGPATPYHAASIRVGASVQNYHSRSSGCKVDIDNVLFDIGNGVIR